MRPFLVVAIMLSWSTCRAQDLHAASAAEHVHDTLTVVGEVAQVTEKKGHVFVNFERPYPNQSFTAFVPKSRLAAAGGMPFLISLTGKTVKVTGLIVSYEGRPE